MFLSLSCSWFLASKGNEYFCEVDEDYIIDRFNLTGLNAEVQGYSSALELITDAAGTLRVRLPGDAFSKINNYH